VRSALLAACSDFGASNESFWPKLRVVRVLALKLLPAYDTAKAAWNASCSVSWDTSIYFALESVCERESIMPPDRSWIRALINTYDEHESPAWKASATEERRLWEARVKGHS
jgi:hypothetical protein